MWQTKLTAAISFALGLILVSENSFAQSLLTVPVKASQSTNEEVPFLSLGNTKLHSSSYDISWGDGVFSAIPNRYPFLNKGNTLNPKNKSDNEIFESKAFYSVNTIPFNSFGINATSIKKDSLPESNQTTQTTKSSNNENTDNNSTPPPNNQKKFLAELYVNGQDQGTQFFANSKDGVLIDAKAFAIAINRVKPYTDKDLGVKTIKNVLFINPAVAVVGTVIKVNLNKGTVELTLPGQAFSGQNVYVNRFAPIPPISSNPSLYLNYSLNTANQNLGSFYGEGGFAWGTSAITTSYLWSKNVGGQRGLTSFQHDDVKHLIHWTIGDQYASSQDGLGGNSGLAGIGVTRAFNLNPYLVTIPQPQISGILQSPGTLEIYKNGTLAAIRPVNAGPFNLENLGVGVGNTNIQVVVRDPFGGTHEISQNFYAVQNTLGEGLTDFTYQLGIQSPQPGILYETNRPVFLATQRWGVKHGFTFGYRAEGEKGLLNGGGSVDWGNKFGGIHLAAASSHSSTAGKGWATNLNYNLTGGRFSFSVGGSYFSNGYRRLGDANTEYLLRSNLVNYDPTTATVVDNTGSTDDSFDYANPTLPTTILSGTSYTNALIQQILAAQRPHKQLYGSAGYTPFAHTMIQASFNRTQYADGHVNKSESLGVSYDLHWSSLYAGYTRSKLGTFQDKTISLTMTISLGENVATASRMAQSGSVTDNLDFQKSLPTDIGYGYGVHLQHDSQSGNQADLQFSAQNNLARMSLQYYKMSGQNSYMGQLSGSVVYIGDEIHLGRPLSGSYALVNVGDGLKNIPIQHENQTVGSTNSNGSFLVTNMLPFQRNQLGFLQEAVPSNYIISKTETDINVPRYGGAVIHFGVHKLRAVKGILKTNKGELIKNGSVVALIPIKNTEIKIKQKLDSPMGSKGNFYLDDVPVGEYTLQALKNGILYNCPIIVPMHKNLIYNLKTIECKPTPMKQKVSVNMFLPLLKHKLNTNENIWT